MGITFAIKPLSSCMTNSYFEWFIRSEVNAVVTSFSEMGAPQDTVFKQMAGDQQNLRSKVQPQPVLMFAFSCRPGSCSKILFSFEWW